MINISAKLIGSVSNPDVIEITLPVVPRIGEIVLDYGGRRYEVVNVFYQPWPREEPKQPHIELDLKPLDLG